MGLTSVADATTIDAPMVEKSFLVQRFAKLKLGQHHVIGYSVAGEESYILLVRVESGRALEELLQQIRTAANVRTRSTIILQTFYAGRDNVP